MEEPDTETAFRASPALARIRRDSLALVDHLGAVLDAAADELEGVCCVVAAGSLGRLEAGPNSDLDVIVVVRDGLAQAIAARLVGRVYERLGDSGLRLPKADGIYRSPVSPAALLDRAARGSLDEDPALFGKRMQFLLDTRALAGSPAFAGLRRDILGWYAGPAQSRSRRHPWTFLINDLSRYLHSYAAWQQHKHDNTADDGWQLRQVKLRSSRVLTFAGLMLLLGESHRERNPFDFVLRWLDLTPLQRVAAVMHRHGAAQLPDLVQGYARVHAALSSADTRAALAAGRDEQLFARLHDDSGTMMEILTQFILARADDWGTDFFSRLLL